MSRLWRIVVWTLYLFALVAVFSTLACMGPTSPSEPYDPPAQFSVIPPNPEQLRLTLYWWERQALCVGISPTVARRVVVTVESEGFYCGVGVLAAGCTYGGEIRIWGRYFEPAISHELIHYALWKSRQDASHRNPAFARCDILNYVQTEEVSRALYR